MTEEVAPHLRRLRWLMAADPRTDEAKATAAGISVGQWRQYKRHRCPNLNTTAMILAALDHSWAALDNTGPIPQPSRGAF